MGNHFLPNALSGGLSSGFKMLLSFWYLIALVIAVRVAPLVWKLYQRRQLAASGIDKIDAMDGREFEEYLGTLFRRKGYHVEVTQYVGDWGGDLVLSKDGVRTAVQAKRWKKNVGNKAVQEVFAAKESYRCTRAMVVTNSYFTEAAKKQAADCKVELWDRDQLVREMLTLARAASPTPETAPETVPPAAPIPIAAYAGSPVVLAPLPSNNPFSKPLPPNPHAVSATRATCATCAVCGKPLTPKVAAYCQANPSRFGGRGLCYEHQKNGNREVEYTSIRK